MTAIEAFKSPHSRVFLEFDKVMHTFSDIDHIKVGEHLGYKIQLNENEILYLMEREIKGIFKGILMAQIDNGIVCTVNELMWIKNSYSITILLTGRSTKIWINLFSKPDVCTVIGTVGKKFIQGSLGRISRVKRSVIGEHDKTMPKGTSHSDYRDPEYNYSIEEDEIIIEIPQHYKPWQNEQQHKDEPFLE